MNKDQPTIYLVPRWAGNIHSDWYDWLTLEIKNNFQIEICRLEMPDWNEPNIEKSLEYLKSNIQELNENTFFIGHSVGCQAILRFLNLKLNDNPDLKIAGVLFVAAWFKVDKPWISLKPWQNNQIIDFERIAKQVLYRKVILSNNDPFTSNFNENKKFWESKLNADVEILPNHLHFNRLVEHSVLKEVEYLIKH